MAENNKAVVIADPVPPSAEASADEAAQNCPVTAITIDS
jgi:ferredoxin